MCSNGQVILFTSICRHSRQVIIIHCSFTIALAAVSVKLLALGCILCLGTIRRCKTTAAEADGIMNILLKSFQETIQQNQLAT